MIEPINLRDTTYVLGNLNEADHNELACQFSSLDLMELAQTLIFTPYAFQARVKGRPVAVFGMHAMTSVTVSAWALGTDESRRAFPTITRFGLGPLFDQLRADGYRWVEARSDNRNELAQGWLSRSLGAEAVAQLTAYGTGGEDFTLFRKAI